MLSLCVFYIFISCSLARPVSETFLAALEPAAEYSSSVQKTYQQDINVRKPSLIGQTLNNPPYQQPHQVLATAPQVLPADEESHHLYKEESENLSKTPIVGQSGVISPISLLHKDNTEKFLKKSSVNKSAISGGVIGPLYSVY